MEADWHETTRIAFPGPAPSAPPGLVTTLAFDTSQELLWAGNEYGRITSFYGADLQRYTSYRGHASAALRGAAGNSPVKQLLVCERGIVSVSSGSVHLANRRGLTQWHIAQSDMIGLRCMCFTNPAASEILVAGCQRQMYRIDVEKGIVTETFSQDPLIACTLMRRTGQYICVASHDGSIHLLDSKTLYPAKSWKAYAGTVNDMDARGDYLLTCGWTQQQYHGLALERLVRVYDLKSQRSVAPVTFGQGAAFVRMHPKLSSTCIVVSQMGAVQSIDVQNPDIPVMRFAQTFDAQLTGLELMPSGKGFAMTDSHGQIVLWSSPSRTQFTEFPQPTEFADITEPVKHLAWSPDAALNLIGMPYYREALLSGWPNSLVHQVGAPPTKLEAKILAVLRKFEHGLVGPNINSGYRYEAESKRRIAKDPNALSAPKFLSEQKRDEDGHYEDGRRLSEDISKTLDSLAIAAGAPVYYQPQKMAYSKFGVDDFDFRYFNHTRYSGLEIHIVNSYANPLLQIFRFTNAIRNSALQHTARDCRFENCMLCEAGFVIDMLEKAEGLICQATNFFKALSKQPNAAGLSILEERTINTPPTTMMQNLIRFLLPTLDDNLRRISGNVGGPQPVLGTRGRAYSTCMACSYEDAKEQIWYSHDLVYPSKATKHPQRNMRHYFSRLLKESLERHDSHRGWCMRCQGYKAIRSRRALLRPPAILTINTAIHSAEAKQMWGTPGFLPREIGIIVHDDQVYCYEGQDLQLHLQRRIHDITVYELVGFVADVITSETQQPHLVSMINVSISSPATSQKDDWHLFNDFMVRSVPAREALQFDARWKLPCVITYQSKQISHYIDHSWRSQIDTSILFRSVAQPTFDPSYQLRPLSAVELQPGSNTHCAIDAEFVRLLREEIDMDANGKRAITRPARSGLGRVSVLRGDGPDEELSFIDDYIATNEPVDDYLTQYSGLHPGDLTIGTSQFTLVSLKEVYKKLWVLLNLGYIFIGHGLSSDFRTINMHVPEVQVIDTQELFSLGERSRRKLSLRFLTWLLLGEDIQKNVAAGHDSIEDARAALKLWRKFLEYEAAGDVERVKDEVFSKGKATDFKVPREDHRLIPETPTVSTPATPERRIATMARTSTPARSELGTPLRDT